MKEVYQCKEKKVLFLKEVISEYFIIASGFFSDEIPFQIVIINNFSDGTCFFDFTFVKQN